MAKRQAAAKRSTTSSTKSKKTTGKKRSSARRPAPAPTPEPPRRPSFPEAIGAFEKGLAALQRHEYREAQATLGAILTSYPQEWELHARVRQYLQVCERHLSNPAPVPETVDERLYAATVALNAGRDDEAAALLDRVHAEDPDNDHALYMLGLMRVMSGDHDGGLDLLRRAIELNPDNRALVKQDPELEALRETDGYRLMLESTASAPDSDGRRAR